MQCQMFKEQEKNKLAELQQNYYSEGKFIPVDMMVCVGKYYPKHGKPFQNMDEFSNKILDIKKDEASLSNTNEKYYYEESIKYFTNKLLGILSDTSEYVMCVMPSQWKGTNQSGIRTIVRQICLKMNNIIDGTDILSRKYTLPKKHLGGERNQGKEIKSLTVADEGTIRDRQILLVDDVTTTGTSLNAGIFVLKQHGCGLVALLALQIPAGIKILKIKAVKMKVEIMLALEETRNIGPKTIEKILSLQDTSEPNNPLNLIEILKKANAKFGKIYIPTLQEATSGWKKSQDILEQSKQRNIQIISKESAYYPKALLQISDPPALLHILGNIEALNKNCIAIVGTRHPTEYGIGMARKISEIFAKKDYVIASGLAEGIDTAAHQGALDVGGLTIAVVGHGLDKIYPAKNKELAEAIIKNKGALVSEYPYGTKISREHLIMRDRIQSGLSQGVFVIETGIKGGTMHTVNFCKKQKRALIFLQHPVKNENTAGNAHLILKKQADIVFKTDEDIEIINTELNRVRNRILHSQDKKKKRSQNSTQMTLV